MAQTLNKDANITKSNSDISEKALFGEQGSSSFLMDVSVDGHAELIQELTDASRDKGAYAIREAISNAFDATVKSGDLSRPVQVTLPDSVSRDKGSGTLAEKLSFIENGQHFAIITDHGVGMTKDELRENFAQYGNSDKRGSGAIGSKGLGSKAPLACADFFEVTSVKDGIETKMLLWREDGGNYAKVVSEKPTHRKSGTTIRIPLTDEETRKQMEHQLTLIAGWNVRFKLVAQVGGNTLRADPKHRLGTQVGTLYKVPMGFSLTSSWYSSVSRYTVNEQNLVYMGKMAIAKSSDGEDVFVDVWRNVDGINGDINDPNGFYDEASIDINLMGVRYPLLRNGSVGSSSDMSMEGVDYIIGCEPGYLNFTVSRDDIKEDDAWRRFVASVREGLAGFDQRPAVIKYVSGMGDAFSSYHFLCDAGISCVKDEDGYHVAGLDIPHETATRMFSYTDSETGEVTDLADLMFISKSDSDGPIRVLFNDRGSMYGVNTDDSHRVTYLHSHRYVYTTTGYHPTIARRLNPTEIRGALEDGIARHDCSCLLMAWSGSLFSSRSLCELDVIILTDMGKGCTRIATADKHIRKYICKEGQRPQDVSVAYVLCEGGYEPTPAEKVVLGWFKSWSIAKFDDYLKECKSGFLLRQKQEAEKRLREKRENQRKQLYRVMATDKRGYDTTTKLLASIAAGTITRGGYNGNCSSGYVNAYQMEPNDIVAIRDTWDEASRDSMRIAWMLLESTGLVTTPSGDDHENLYFITASTAKGMGIYEMGDDRRFDVLYDSTGRLDSLMPKQIRFDEGGYLNGTADDFGISGSTPELLAAMLRCEKDICYQAIGGFYRIAGTTGNKKLDRIIKGNGLDTNWLSENGTSYYRLSSEGRINIVLKPTPRLDNRYQGVRQTAKRLTELWGKGIGQVASGALPKDPDRRSLIRGMSYETLRQAMAALV